MGVFGVFGDVEVMKVKLVMIGLVVCVELV